jgi:gag-polypeptide of LTR copia-type/Zinc knuckle
MTEFKASFAKLDVDNYAAWAGKMKCVFLVQRLWTTVSGQGDVDAALDERALGFIGLNVEDHHMALIATCDSAKQAWDALKGIYQAASYARRLQLKMELNSLRLDGGETIAKYAARAAAMRDQLQAAGSSVPEDELVLSMLVGLQEDFKVVVTIIRSSDKPLTIMDVLPKLLQEDQLLRRMDKHEDTAAAFYSKAFKNKRQPPKVGGSVQPQECWYCGKTGHFKQDCKKRAADEAVAGWASGGIAL